MPTSVRWALGVALLLVLLSLLSFSQTPQSIVTLLVFGVVAFHLWRKSSWGAFGGALILTTEAAKGLWMAGQGETGLALPSLLISSTAILLGAGIFFLAGKKLQHGVPISWSEGRPWIALCLLLNVIPLLCILVYRPYVIPTGSMEETLSIGDHVLAGRWRPSTIARGDILVHLSPDRTLTLVKRVIGIPGDRIRIVNKQLFLNGSTPTEPYAIHKDDYLDSFRDNFPSNPNVPVYPSASDMLVKHVSNGEVLVPEGFYFMMGDNRDRSLDSRFQGFVPAANIVGTPVLIYWSVDTPTGETTNWITQTRWSRTFQRVRSFPFAK